MGKIDDAIAKITQECEGKEYLIPFEEYLTSVCTTDAVAEKILAEDKKLQGCFDHMKNIARKRAVGSCGYIPNDEGFEIIEAYYNITATDKAAAPKVTGNIIDITDFF